MVVKNLKQLEDILRKKVAECLEDDVAEAIKEVQKKHINSDVYGKYSPVMYERRGSDGGLSDDSNIVAEVDESTLSLSVSNITPPNKSVRGIPFNSSDKMALSSWIEYGLVPNIFNEKQYVWMEPRPFIRNTVDDLKTNKQHVDAMKKGLAKRGMKVK